MDLSPKELDAQSPVQIDEWVDLDSERWRDTDNDPTLTKDWLKKGLAEPPFMFLDSLGRVWGSGKNGNFYPFHYEYGKKRIGIRIAKRAAN